VLAGQLERRISSWSTTAAPGPITLDVTGSLTSGLALREGSDMDLSLDVPEGYGRRSVPADYLKRVYQALRGTGVSGLHTRPRARVPIAHFHVSVVEGFPGGLDVDISVANQQGVENSALLAQCVEAVPVMAPFTLYMKAVLKNTFRSVTSGTFNLAYNNWFTSLRYIH